MRKLLIATMLALLLLTVGCGWVCSDLPIQQPITIDTSNITRSMASLEARVELRLLELESQIDAIPDNTGVFTEMAEIKATLAASSNRTEQQVGRLIGLITRLSNRLLILEPVQSD